MDLSNLNRYQQGLLDKAAALLANDQQREVMRTRVATVLSRARPADITTLLVKVLAAELAEAGRQAALKKSAPRYTKHQVEMIDRVADLVDEPAEFRSSLDEDLGGSPTINDTSLVLALQAVSAQFAEREEANATQRQQAEKDTQEVER